MNGSVVGGGVNIKPEYIVKTHCLNTIADVTNPSAVILLSGVM